jgi:hypothetical protein
MAPVALAALAIALVPILAWGARTGAARAQVPGAERLGIGVAAGLAGWLALTGVLAGVGALAVFDVAPPRVLLLAVSAALVGIGLTRAPLFGRVLAGVPVAWPVALQGFRLVVELVLYQGAREGLIPVQMTFEGRNFDVLTGLTGPLVLFADRLGRAGLLGWNLVGVGLLANVVGIAITSFPGPLHADWPGAPLTEPARFPFVWLPAFLVPLALFLHVVSIRQALARR